ncbi:Mo-dependent nitrogenase C-terminal domain-containing protein [Gloeocapsopsis crepidinum LEGE 06123]|uniref:Mo-dependent nitrogenase C-terminal domain-containing protein n=1 Tax=Gloeocapsopsis crepidinum LEGE 06123 TaxID=588587 RepID=A0ABR9UXA8_9CHRO|nr:Mo-dependent nitrogenase C-terminal domain-containing protein [Gloeocapsopsis crepidinum]MBE9192190.1 Mo-dependent nitrogenase C-terminal domain-containing protein [Gloeocapsopsis crepidinum LEGE 06123]
MSSLTLMVPRLKLLQPTRQFLESIEIRNPQVARLLCRIIPNRCPFEREIKLFNYTILHIPPLCKLNPFYEQVMLLRFKCLSYLADEFGEVVLG